MGRGKRSCGPYPLRIMKSKIFARIAVLVSATFIATGIILMLAGQSGVEQKSSPTLENAAHQDAEGGSACEINWPQLPETAIAWIKVPGTKIDYPVAQGALEDPDFYLSHDIEGLYSVWGTPYVAADCTDGLGSKFVVVYGHHMSDGTVFANLASFSDLDYAKEHEDVILYTREGERNLKVAAVNVVNASYEQPKYDFASWEELSEYMNSQVAESEVVLREVPEGRQVYAFVTCSYQTSNSRTIVYAIEE